MGVAAALLVAVAPSLAAAGPAPSATALERISFESRIVNLEVAAIELTPRAPRSVVEPPGEPVLYHGQIVRRPASGVEPGTVGDVAFAVRLDGGVVVRAWCDQNGDRDLTNDPPPVLTGYPGSATARAFLVDLRWTARADWKTTTIERKVRVVIDSPDGADAPPSARIQDVHAMVGTWGVDGRALDVVLFDGDADGLYTTALGDGFFVDSDGDKFFSIDPFSPDFAPFAVPFQIGRRVWQVDHLDPTGRSLTLHPLREAPEVTPALIGRPAPTFEYTTMDGTPGRLADWRGSYTILYFWASWCGTCETQAAPLAALLERHRSAGVRILGISYDKDRARADAFRVRHAETWPSTFTGRMLWEDPVGRLYHVRGPGTFQLIDPKGVLLGEYQDPTALDEALTRHLERQERPSPAAPGRSLTGADPRP